MFRYIVRGWIPSWEVENKDQKGKIIEIQLEWLLLKPKIVTKLQNIPINTMKALENKL